MLWSLLSLAAVLDVAIAGGITTVRCNVTDLDWSFNKAGQSPCQVAANLGAVCSSSGNYEIGPLEPVAGNYYTPSSRSTPCECSTVVYSLAAACGLCQGGTFTSWLEWQANCTAISPAVYPFNIPSDTSVPSWAYLDPRGSNRFNPVAAQAAGGAESSAASTPTSSTTATPPSDKKSNAGAIAGGVVGGVVAIALLGLLVWFLMKRKKRAASAPASHPYDDGYNGGSPASPPPPSIQKPYDPNDPTTYPNSPGPSMYQHQQTPMSYPQSYPATATPSVNSTLPLGARPGGYSGVAEV